MAHGAGPGLAGRTVSARIFLVSVLAGFAPVGGAGFRRSALRWLLAVDPLVRSGPGGSPLALRGRVRVTALALCLLWRFTHGRSLSSV